MNTFKQITSLQNPLIKKTLVLKDKSRERKKTNIFVLEGARELQLALKGGYIIETLFFCKDLISNEALNSLTKNSSAEVIEVSLDVYQKIAYRSTTEGVVALVNSKEHNLNSLQLSTKKPLILIAEAPEKPGNIGALLRTADAANLDAVIIANPKTDLYNPNIIRSSVGCVFTTKIATGTTTEIITYLKENNIATYCAALTASKTYTTIDYTSGSAIVVGTEATGLSNQWLDNSTQNIIIPMEGQIDSMNVSVAAAIVIFEAKRQRG
ncbi:MAG: TrmH family RNA methyltransferase [Cellulophaga sp.]|uniref:TrmH family RNA methyltransferase n=1 Tax=unclassified Cellulophaga TaxID=2634405 RepID=UPI0026E3BBD4|nr:MULTISPECIES: RNA methyltransferase [unclassified Cellulophaga]MDO6492002.1 RNA methyltransferase [Cellulophaga sp. 2_MG-2023]MDO6495838.1 RNA methyltransferase [Cellulophaga sp. 3_MG-2023]